MDNDETYLLLLLSDSNLPTGSFVASSGFESYIKHGFGTADAGDSRTGNKMNKTIVFMHNSINAYARSALPFMSDAHRIVQGIVRSAEYSRDSEKDLEPEEYLKETLQKIQQVDDLYDVMTLNHVTKRASKSQGVALLTLYSKGFSSPLHPSSSSDVKKATVDYTMASLVAKYKTCIRSECAPGHLPICWGILTGALGLTLERSQYLHIFLYARSLLSASVRLNEIGPYNAQQILLRVSRLVIEAEVENCKDLRTGIRLGLKSGESKDAEESRNFDKVFNGPANTWPLGEILAARHDLQHSRIFNS
ncbi:hypothetical protein J3R30DRAFT_2735477 [Lentinula aciculospora]|uniref:Urease accessory protein UreF n=1 Tax=Lentinula aciculospora TaxID=153920 RepID=A0A9W9DPC5_9AGAR|nr:hypothetical protein J3R30DRAFT_2735477 [Lentinula aciculospora]